MASTTPTNGSNPLDSKTAKKRKAKPVGSSSAEDSVTGLPEEIPKTPTGGQENGNESPFLKELTKYAFWTIILEPTL